LHGLLAAAAAGGVFVNFTEKSLRTILGNLTKTPEGIGNAATQPSVSERGIGCKEK
jgi:hypothetical protein